MKHTVYAQESGTKFARRTFPRGGQSIYFRPRERYLIHKIYKLPTNLRFVH